MNTPPNDPHNYQRRRVLQQEEEAFLLEQEEARLEAARRANTFAWLTNSVSLLVGLLEVLLALRFILRLLGANTQNAFAQFIYSLSKPFIAPFSTLFVSPVTAEGASIFDVNVLVAMLIYGLLGVLVISIIRYIQGRG